MEKIRWNEPRFDRGDIDSVINVLENNYVNEGPKTLELEEELKKYLGVKHVIMVANGTAALFLAIKADAIIKGLKEFEVIVPDMTMIATATAVGWAGGNVQLVDVEKAGFTIDTEKIENKITKKTSAIIPVHIFGRAANMDKINEIAIKHNLTIIEDAAGALGSTYKGKNLGTIGKVGCFSLQSNKIITCGQGGIISTDDDKYYEVMRRLRDFGRASNKEFIHEMEGYNLKFSDLAAALVFSQLKRIEKKKQFLVKQRQLYEKMLADIQEINIPRINYPGGEIPLWVDIIVENRKRIVEHLKAEEILTRECWPAIHRNPPYSSLGEDGDFPVSSFVADKCLWLPNGPHLSDDKIISICNKIKNFYNIISKK